MDPIDWTRVHLMGMKGYEEAIKLIEAEVAGLGRQLVDLKAGLRPLERMEVVWFRRYAALMQVLLEAGLPEELELEEVAGWLKRQLAGESDDASRNGDRTVSGTGLRRMTIAELGGGWKIEAISQPLEGGERIYFRKCREGEVMG